MNTFLPPNNPDGPCRKARSGAAHQSKSSPLNECERKVKKLLPSVDCELISISTIHHASASDAHVQRGVMLKLKVFLAIAESRLCS